ncbi:hypothetical protein CY34DRAFT_620082 [Suillus luteus UH-Slu-Lm8-n1]|uniref:Uncharacterized protein n=1 Tax=Suillus luteus UH-Slu-Lm8-n1 TaxID=930992 RepID=A0A0D0BEI2_9AGAM|nr:hypothetical protein CY34DRAFT_620082 [Suillus luteus UH-Slu-Lm8-n1]
MIYRDFPADTYTSSRCPLLLSDSGSIRYATDRWPTTNYLYEQALTFLDTTGMVQTSLRCRHNAMRCDGFALELLSPCSTVLDTHSSWHKLSRVANTDDATSTGCVKYTNITRSFGCVFKNTTKFRLSSKLQNFTLPTS